VDGDVAFSDSLNPTAQDNEQWVAATPNQSFSVGDRIYTRENSHASLAFSGRNFARLNPNTNLDVIDLSDSRTQLALRDGSAIFDVGYLTPGQLFEVGTPYGAVDFNEPGLYNVGFDNNGSVLVSVLSGLAQVVGLGGSGRISKGELLTLAGQTAAQVALSRLNGRDAGYAVDDYYRNQYPNTYDGRYTNYDAYLNDPYYYDPYRHDVSYQYASATIPGLNDLAYYGDWQNVDGYGNVWRPRVANDWVPYQQGQWVNDYPYGPTWVSSEPWGYAPYHYGRWANVNNQWLWVPDSVNSTPRYAPALVAFVPLTQANEIGWVPLAPGDPYVAHYYDQNWQPYYLTRNVQPQQVINLEVPGAVTVVPVDQFGRMIDPHSLRKIDRQAIAGVRPVLDPLMFTPLRNAVVHSAWGRGKIDLPPGIAKKLAATQVITSVVPPASPFRKDWVRAMRVQQVPDKVKHEQMKFKDMRNEQAADTRQQMHELEKQQREQQKAADQSQREQQKAAEQAQRAVEHQQRAVEKHQPKAERVGNPAKPAEHKPRVEFKGPPKHEQMNNAPQPQQQQKQAAPKHENKGQGKSDSNGGGGGKGKGKKG
jgi:hypothetical protein